MAETQTLAAPQDFGSEQETQTTTESQVPADVAGTSSSASQQGQSSRCETSAKRG